MHVTANIFEFVATGSLINNNKDTKRKVIQNINPMLYNENPIKNRIIGMFIYVWYMILYHYIYMYNLYNYVISTTGVPWDPGAMRGKAGNSDV